MAFGDVELPMATSSSAANEPERDRPARKGLRTTLFVRNLPELPVSELEQLLYKAFGGERGKLSECEVLCAADGSSRGIAFVRLQNGRRAEEAKAAIDGTRLTKDSAAVQVRWSLDVATLFVGDLAPEVTGDELKEAFRQFGNVVDCRIEKEPVEFGGASKLYGFVEYSKRTVAAKVQQLLSENLFLVSNSPRPVRVEFALDSANDDAEGRPVGSGLVVPPPHFAQPGSLEFDFALKWRELALAHKSEDERLHELHRQEREVLRLEQREVYRQECYKFDTLEQIGGGRGSSKAAATGNGNRESGGGGGKGGGGGGRASGGKRSRSD